MDLLKFAEEQNIPVSSTPKAPWSMDDNIIHCSYEAGVGCLAYTYCSLSRTNAVTVRFSSKRRWSPRRICGRVQLVRRLGPCNSERLYA